MLKVTIFNLLMLVMAIGLVQRECKSQQEKEPQKKFNVDPALTSFLEKEEVPIFEDQLSTYPAIFFICSTASLTLICFIASYLVKEYLIKDKREKAFEVAVVLGIISFIVTVALLSNYLVSLEHRKFLITDKRLIYRTRLGAFQFVYFDTITYIFVSASIIDHLFDLNTLEVFDKNGNKYVLSGMKNAKTVASVLKKTIDKHTQGNVRLYY